MTSQTLTRLIERLEEIKRPGSADEDRVLKLLDQIARRKFMDAGMLIRFHEALLFMRAYPQSPGVLKKVEAILRAFPNRVRLLGKSGADLEPFHDSEASGIAGISLTASFSYPVARWLITSHPSEVAIDWEGYEDGARLGGTLPRFIPLLEEESLVEANVPYTEWLRAARGRENEAMWLIERFESLPVGDSEKAELYDSLKLYLHWKPRNFSVTRTGMKLRARHIFYHDAPMLARRDISLVKELNSNPLPVEKLSHGEGKSILDAIRDTSTLRYRELHGFSYGDPSHVIRASAGRGVEFYVNGVGPEDRLPLRAYTSAFMVKNGVPIGYVEGLSLFEKMEVGFNIYYTFRDGESAWLYARTLRLFRQMLGVTTFSVDPYQIGFENEEGIESGAFWFYRKMGFRPVLREVEKLVQAEEVKIAGRSTYRTRAETLRQIAVGHMLFELKPDQQRRWDTFQLRNLGLAVGRRMASHYGGDAGKMRRAAVKAAERLLGVTTDEWTQAERQTFENMALILSLIPNLSKWASDDRKAVVRIVRAKAAADESGYLRLLQQHKKLRDEVLSLGS